MKPGPTHRISTDQLLWQGEDLLSFLVRAFLLVTFSLQIPLPQLLQQIVSATSAMQENAGFRFLQKYFSLMENKQERN